MTRRLPFASATLAAAMLIGALAMPSAAAGQTPVPNPNPSPDEPSFTPFTVAPQLLNVEEVRDALVRAYPTDLREAGIGGVTTTWFFLDAEGVVQNTLVAQSSGNEQLDQAALSVSGVYRFSPAMNRENRVPVWIALPITFEPEETPPND
jgi:protein TonB